MEDVNKDSNILKRTLLQARSEVVNLKNAFTVKEKCKKAIEFVNYVNVPADLIYHKCDAWVRKLYSLHYKVICLKQNSRIENYLYS